MCCTFPAKSGLCCSLTPSSDMACDGLGLEAAPIIAASLHTCPFVANSSL